MQVLIVFQRLRKKWGDQWSRAQHNISSEKPKILLRWLSCAFNWSCNRNRAKFISMYNLLNRSLIGFYFFPFVVADYFGIFECVSVSVQRARKGIDKFVVNWWSTFNLTKYRKLLVVFSTAFPSWGRFENCPKQSFLTTNRFKIFFGHCTIGNIWLNFVYSEN